MKILTVVLLMFVPLVAYAADPADLRWEIYSQMQFDTDGVERLDTAALDTIISRGVKEVGADYLLSINDTVVDLVYGQTSYSMPSDFYGRPGERNLVWVLHQRDNRMDPTDTGFAPIQIVPATGIYEVMAERKAPIDFDKSGPWYAWTWDSSLYVWPAPKQADSLWVGYRAKATISNFTVESAYRERLIQWCIWHAFLKLRMFDEAREWERIYKGANSE